MTNRRHSATIEEVIFLAKRDLGQVTEAELDRGWQRLASRLAQGQHLERPISLRPRLPWGTWAPAGAVAVVPATAAYRLPLLLLSKVHGELRKRRIMPSNVTEGSSTKKFSC